MLLFSREIMKITIAGAGYVGLANALLFCKKHEVVLFDIDPLKVDSINQKISPIKDNLIESLIKESGTSLSATDNRVCGFNGVDLVILSTPTHYDEDTNYFDTTSIENLLFEISNLEEKPLVVIKSTVPVGFTERMAVKHPGLDLIFCPEFLREGYALFDNLHPSRIVVGGKNQETQKIVGDLFKNASLESTVPVLYTSTEEAEAIKLFSNAYLAMRVAFFNELDSYSLTKNLDARNVIKGVSLDSRIGNYYNNPSFGYGGYCLPKDTKQLLANFKEIPQNLISATILSNDTRKKYIVEQIKKRNPKTVGVYRLVMKEGSDNFRESAIQDIISLLVKENIKIIIYEPILKDKKIDSLVIEENFEHFKEVADLILANRMSEELEDVLFKVYTRDLFVHSEK